MRALTIAILAGAVLIAGCGDDSGTDDSGAAEPAADAASSDDASADDSGSDDGGSAPSDSDSDDSGADDSGDVQDMIDDLDFGDGLARVTVGDASYEFTLGGNETADGTTYIGVCQELFGLLNGSGFVSGDPSTTIEFEIPPADWDTYDDGRYDNSTPRIEIELGDDGGWAADMAWGESNPAYAGQSQIDDWTLDGSTASGTATFIEMEPFSAPVEGATGVPGTFEVGCASE